MFKNTLKNVPLNKIRFRASLMLSVSIRSIIEISIIQGMKISKFRKPIKFSIENDDSFVDFKSIFQLQS